jgi:hypothetical protein
MNVSKNVSIFCLETSSKCAIVSSKKDTLPKEVIIRIFLIAKGKSYCKLPPTR